MSIIRLPSLTRLLALGWALHAAATYAADAPPPRCAPHLSLVASESGAEVPDVDRPEPFNAGRAALAPPLDPAISRLSHVRRDELIRGEHVAVTVREALRVSTPDVIERRIWAEMLEILIGSTRASFRQPHARGLLREIYEGCQFITVRARLGPDLARHPFAALTLGEYHYAVQLRSRIPAPRPDDPTHARIVRTYHARRCPANLTGPEFANPLPGAPTNRGFFKGRLVGLLAPDGEIEPVFNVPSPRHTVVTGTWHYADDWLILRLFL